MALRLGGLTDLDPETVPLPAGTEVVTRVDRDGLPKGAIGRISALAGDAVDVTIVDGRTARYLRSEVAPRKVGVARYAQRPAAAWEALRPCVVLEAVVGSRAWELAHEGSDEDRRGVFVLPFAWTTGLVDPPLDLLSEDGTQARRLRNRAMTSDPR